MVPAETDVRGHQAALPSPRRLAAIRATGQNFCHFTIEGETPQVIPDTKAHPVYCVTGIHLRIRGINHGR